MGLRGICWGGIIFAWIWATAASAATISEILDAVAGQPGMTASRLAVEEKALESQAAQDVLYPVISLFGRAEMYNSPTNLRPMPPTEVNVSAGESLPFSRRILRSGVQGQMPVYAPMIYALGKKLDILTREAQVADRINLTTRLAKAVSLNSTFQYLVNLDKSISARMKSLEKTRDNVALKVKTGRSSEAELLKIDNSLIELAKQQNDLQIRIMDIKENINRISGLDLLHPADMALASPTAHPQADLIGVKKAQLTLAAADQERVLRQAAFYPVLSLYGSLSRNFGEAYNTGDDIDRDYHSAGLVLTFPLFEKSLSTQTRLARVKAEKARNQLADTKIELRAAARALMDKQPVIEKSLALAGQTVKNNEQLLKIAKVAFDSGRTTTEDYLDYESRVLVSQAGVHGFIDQKWQIIAQQAVLYGTDLRGMIK